MSRLSLLDPDKEVHDWFVDRARQPGCRETVDAMGNIFAVKAGLKLDPPTCAGPHLDTQLTGGRYVSQIYTVQKYAQFVDLVN